MDNNNDRLVTDKPEPMKNIDWILIGILVLLLLITFPVLIRIYRFFIPLVFVGLLIYFVVKFIQLGKISSSNPDGTSPDFAKVWTEITCIIRKQSRVVVISSIFTVTIAVAVILVFNQYSKSGLTENRMNRMAQAMEKYKSHLGYYPASLTDLIGNDPLKREWYQDCWGNNMGYTLTKEGGYRLSSVGGDGKDGTSDDLKLKK